MPKDSLGVFSISDQSLEKHAPVVDFKIPEKWSGSLAFRLDQLPEVETSEEDSIKSKSVKKVGKDNGYHLVVKDLESGSMDTIPFITEYHYAKKGKAMLLHSSGKDSTFEEGVYFVDLPDMNLKPLFTGEHSYKQLAISEAGDQAVFLVDTVSEEPLIRNYFFTYWKKGMESGQLKIDSLRLREGWIVSEHGRLSFSENGERIFLGTTPKPLVQDTSLLEDEIIQVEVWNYKDKRLQTQQENNKKEDQKENYIAVYYPGNDQFYQVGLEHIPNISFSNRKRNNKYAVGVNDQPYYQKVSWEGFPPYSDLYLVNLENGRNKIVEKEIRAYTGISPGNEYIWWYSVTDTSWFAYDISSGEKINLSAGIPTSVADELDDHPDYPNPYGVAGWTKNDREVLIYDRFDIWSVDPGNPGNPVNLTNSRSDSVRFRYRDLDDEDPFIDLSNCYLHFFDEESKDEGFAKLARSGKPETLITGSFAFDDLKKAEESEKVMFTKENNLTFPDILSSDLSFSATTRISNANPQQSDKRWSTNELITWTSLNGDELEGILYKPEGFDRGKKYPMMVYFYERNSHNLNNYWGAYPHRSIINPNYYASRGYLVFIPDIIYRDGYPGPSCYDAVIPGVTKLIDMGFVDKENIGVQGHSWGGYQSAYLITRTDIFAAAESGAPVSNMFSAYGGIRWGSGLSRMFQYEHTQSRIGGTIWEYPRRYTENSPIFFVDKINTPVLIMHNDQDGAVPWYQGIEFFVALRRLNKPAWMLNYNDEPHWPTKRENIIDFQTRMQQFFDHYLMEKPMPEWMSEGIPAIEKGINRGY